MVIANALNAEIKRFLNLDALSAEIKRFLNLGMFYSSLRMIFMPFTQGFVDSPGLSTKPVANMTVILVIVLMFDL